MSVYEKFTTTSAALAAFSLGKCRRHVEVGGHVIDLVQAMAEQGRVREEPPRYHAIGDDPSDRETWDRRVAAWTAAALSGAKFTPPKPAPVCPYCLRPEGPT